MKRAEYETKAAQFRARLVKEAAKPRGQQVWPEPDEWLSVTGTATCATPTCGALGVTFEVLLYENADGNYRVECGKCGNAIEPVLNLED